MFCKNCGNELNSNEKYCNKCGCEIDNNVEKINSVSDADFTDTAVVDSNISYNKNKIIGISIVLLIMAIIGIVFGVHFNSESYKINKATDYLLNGKTSNALNKISNIYTPQTDVMREFSYVIDSENNFKTYCDSKNSFGVSADENDYAVVENFIESVEKFYETYENQIYLLPVELQDKASYYQKICDSIKELGSKYSTFSHLLAVYRNGFLKNRIHLDKGVMYTVGTDYFHLNDLSKNVKTTNAAYENWIDESIPNFDIQDVTKNDESTIDFTNSVFTEFINDCNELAESCKKESDSEKEYIDDALKEFDGSDPLYLENENKSYTVSIISSLPDASRDNFGEFSLYFTHSLQFNLLRYYLIYCE